MKPTISECYYLIDGKCCSIEIYRKVKEMDTGLPCPFSPDELVFKTNNTSQPTCLEFTPKRS